MHVFELIQPRRFADERGILELLEDPRELPFVPKRVFWVTGVPKGDERGFHAHKVGMQMLFCLKGAIQVRLKTHDEEESLVIDFESPGVWMKNMVWGEQKFLTDDAILLVVASNEFDESDYLRDFDSFMKLSEQGF
ncbi:MAG: WxcM-like domain-containing protein [Euryarchaeota archaeon]|nr:WxcM-like domain-containing protein [Euryarchaeota archaeon]